MALAIESFAQTWMLWVAGGLVLAAVGAGVWIGLRGRGTDADESPILVSRASRVRDLPGYRAAVRRQRVLLSGLVVIGVLGLAAAGVVAARPQAVKLIQPETANRDIVLCLDVSGSMQEVVVETLQVFEKMVAGFEGERIGLTIFNSSPVQIFPLTDDYTFVQRELARMQSSFDYVDAYPEHWAGTLNGPGASLIGDGLASCVIGFDHEGEERSRTVILATDNDVQGAQTVTTAEAAAFAKQQRVRVYAINPVDSSEGGPAAANVAELNEAMLATGGRAYALREQTAVSDIVAKVQKQEAKLIQGEHKLALADAPNVWISIFATLTLIFITIVWRVKR